MIGNSGPWGATLVRFLFGIPFSLGFVLIAFALMPRSDLHWSSAFWTSAIVGAGSQILGTAAYLNAADRSGFAVATTLQQSSLPLAALTGLIIYGDNVSGQAWTGIAIATMGLAALSWPFAGHARGSRAGTVTGLISGSFVGFSLNAFRHATLALGERHEAFAAIVCVSVIQVMQAAALIAYLLWRDPAALGEVMRRWRSSLRAGFCGASASASWFVALALAPAASVRALGIVEVAIAAVVGHRIMHEALSARQIVAGAIVAVGVVLTTLS